MIIAFIAGLAFVALLIFFLVQMDTDEESVGVSISNIRREEAERRRRLDRLTTAYELAKEELGEEPTFDQIILTRDSMEDFDGPPR